METVLAIILNLDLNLDLNLNLNLDVLNAHTMMDSRAGGSTTTITSAISQADLLRHSTFHAYGLSRTAAVLAGIQRNLPLAHLASTQAHDALPAYLLAVQRISSSTAVDNGVQLGRGPPAVRPRPGWDNSAVTKDSIVVEHGNDQKEEEEERRKEAMLAVPTYMALHNPVCSKCGIASLPGLTSSSSRPPPAKKRRRGSAVKEKEGGTPSRPFVNNAKCLLCEGDVIPGHAASDPKLEQVEREVAISSRARFGSVKKRERLRVAGGRAASSGGGREGVSLDVGARTRRSLDGPSMAAAAREEIAVPIPTLVPIIPRSPAPAPAPTPALAPLQAPAPAPPIPALAPFKAPAPAPASKPAAAPNPNPNPSPFARPATLPPHPSRPTPKGKTERKKDRAAALRDILGSRDKQQGGGGPKGGGRDKDSGKKPPPSGSSGGGLADFLSLL
ncbi:hypothetical protein CF326_g3949 [Tilletia indica]|nr:hypothetical protein CF326_g3949 [Tilletia indica]